MTTARASLDDTRRMLALLAQPGDVYELRGLVRVNGQQHTTSGYFDDVEALVREAGKRSGQDVGVYITLNPVKPALLARAPKNQVRRAGSGDTTGDRDVMRRRSILVDIDPVRPAGISSTDQEHNAAIALARAIRSDLDDLGFPRPILADSGNGGHLIYSVDLPVDDDGLVKRVLARLSAKYSTADLKVDEKVFNASRISKVYGTLTRKGENTADRPHRLASIIEAPQKLEAISRELLEQFASVPAPRQSSTQSNTKQQFDLDAWIAKFLPDAKERPWDSGRRWIIPVCPINEQHDRGEAFVTQSHDGKISAGCQHESCFKTWRDLSDHLDADMRERRLRYEQSKREEQRPREPEVIYQANDYRDADDVFADRDTEPAKQKHPWRQAPDLVSEIWDRKDEKWPALFVGTEELCRIRPGGIAVVIGGSGSGKSSLVSNMLIQHARDVGPAIALSIELPADELAARIVGIRCDESWENTLRGHVRHEWMVDALNIPRLFVLDRKHATLENLARCAEHVSKLYPSEPILAAIDYAQLIHSKEREVRLRVADAFERIDDIARDKRIVTIAVSQMSRVSASQAAAGEKIGAESASLGAESAAIERFATVTLAIGQKGEPRGDGSCSVELSIGKGRMTGGDRVVPMSYFGRSGLWRVAGEARTAAEVRAERDQAKNENTKRDIENQLVGAATRSSQPLSREQLQGSIAKGNKAARRAAITSLLSSGELVEVARYAPKSRLWMVWTPDRARDAGIPLVRDTQSEEGS